MATGHGWHARHARAGVRRRGSAGPRTCSLAALAAVLSLTARPAAAQGAEPDVVFVPSPRQVVDAMMEMAQVRNGDVVYDLGCGDGRIPIAAVKRGATRAVCVDIDSDRIAEARENARSAGVADRIRFLQGDLFEIDFSDATVVTLYLLPSLNLRLRPKLLALAPGTRVVSHSFDMGDWKPDEVRRVAGQAVYAWKVPPRPP